MITVEAYRASIGSFCPKAQHTQLSELDDLSGAYKGYKFTNHNAEQIYFLKAFVAFLIVVILYLNMNLAIFKLLKLLIDLPETVIINGHVLKVEMLSNVNRLLGASILFDKDLLPGNGLIFTTNGYCFSLIWAKQNVFLFDSHSRNKEGSFV